MVTETQVRVADTLRYSTDMSRRNLLGMAALGLAAGVPSIARAATAPAGQLTYGVHVSLAPTWFDPADTLGIITPFMVLYALHDAMVKPMPGATHAPCLAELWTDLRGQPHLRIRHPRGRQIP